MPPPRTLSISEIAPLVPPEANGSASAHGGTGGAAAGAAGGSASASGGEPQWPPKGAGSADGPAGGGAPSAGAAGEGSNKGGAGKRNSSDTEGGDTFHVRPRVHKQSRALLPWVVLPPSKQRAKKTECLRAC